MDSTDTNKATFLACIDQIPSICSVITQAARDAGMEEGNIWKLETAVDEACTNISSYGYQNSCKGPIWLYWKTLDGKFIVIIEDMGIPFDQSQPTHPDLSCNICERQIGGLGRHIMRQFLDDMQYQRENDRNCLTLVKSLHEKRESAAS